jgi:hypothetical protein
VEIQKFRLMYCLGARNFNRKYLNNPDYTFYDKLSQLITPDG